MIAQKLFTCILQGLVNKDLHKYAVWISRLSEVSLESNFQVLGSAHELSSVKNEPGSALL